MKKRFTEEQIIGILREAEAGMKVGELCRKHGISDATYYNWKAKFGGAVVFNNFMSHTASVLYLDACNCEHQRIF